MAGRRVAVRYTPAGRRDTGALPGGFFTAIGAFMVDVIPGFIFNAAASGAGEKAGR